MHNWADRVLCEVRTEAEETSDDRCKTETDGVICEVRAEAEEINGDRSIKCIFLEGGVRRPHQNFTGVPMAQQS